MSLYEYKNDEKQVITTVSYKKEHFRPLNKDEVTVKEMRKICRGAIYDG